MHAVTFGADLEFWGGGGGGGALEEYFIVSAPDRTVSMAMCIQLGLQLHKYVVSFIARHTSNFNWVGNEGYKFLSVFQAESNYVIVCFSIHDSYYTPLMRPVGGS